MGNPYRHGYFVKSHDYRASSCCSWAISCWNAASIACFSSWGRKLWRTPVIRVSFAVFASKPEAFKSKAGSWFAVVVKRGRGLGLTLMGLCGLYEGGEG